MSKILNLYKVSAEGWHNAEYSAASNHLEAIDNVSAIHDLVPGECSVQYVGKVYLSNTKKYYEQK